MRGRNSEQPAMFHYYDIEDRIPPDHPLRVIKAFADAALRDMSRVFADMYSKRGRPSIPPERLLKSQLLVALYSVRSDRLFCELLEYNLLFRWFLDMDPDEVSFDPSTFSKNRDRLLEHSVAHRFFDAVVCLARNRGLLSDEHFSVDGTLIEAWASQKSFRPKDDPRNGSGSNRDFRGERRSNATHESTTDPEARLARRAKGQAAKLSYAAHALLDNRYGLCLDFAVTQATGTAEPEAALAMLDRQRRKRVYGKTLGADKGYHTKRFVHALREQAIRPHIAQKANTKIPGLDGRTTRTLSYARSLQLRKLVEEVFGWAKTVGGLRKSRFRGRARTELYALFVGTAYNLLRIGRLETVPG